MNLTIFESTGKVGLNLVEQALAKGHKNSAFTRSPEKFAAPHDNLTIVKADVLNIEAVHRAVTGSDSVLCALGMPLLSKEGLLARGTKIIVDAMMKTGGSRFICLSALGVGDSKELLPLHYKYFLKPLLMDRLYADHTLQESYVTASNLDWTIIRPGIFSKGPHTGTYRHGFVEQGRAHKISISPADFADFMLEQLVDAR